MKSLCLFERKIQSLMFYAILSIESQLFSGTVRVSDITFLPFCVIIQVIPGDYNEMLGQQDGHPSFPSAGLITALEKRTLSTSTCSVSIRVRSVWVHE